ncbi:MAG: hypothetical protein ACRD59_19265 [Candidatus Acidiferrales bacterium]
MDRKLIVVALCALASLSVAASAAFGQGQQKAVPKLHIIHATKAAKAETAEGIKNDVAAMGASKKSGLPLFTYNIQSDRDGQSYTGVIVGADPFSKQGNKQTNVKTFIVPLIIVTKTIGTDIDANGNIVTAPGVTVFDPTKNDNSCLAAPNNNPLKLFQHSPIFDNYDISVGGVDLGHTQYIDAFQRAEFFNVLKDPDEYQVLLNPIQTMSPIVIQVPAASGITLPPQFGACGPFGIVDIDFFDNVLNQNVLPALQPQVNAGNFPIFMLYNTVLAFNPIQEIFVNCCVLGYHGNTVTTPIQAYSPSDFDTTGVFGPTQGDSNTLSHEVAEFVNDPFGNNPTPAWGGVGQVPPGFCQNNLEVGDPLSGTNFSPIGGRNGFTYHLQELAFFSWFYTSQSAGIHGWFSDNDTFTTDAGPVCVPTSSGGGNVRPIGHK